MVNKEKCTLYHMHALNINVIDISKTLTQNLQNVILIKMSMYKAGSSSLAAKEFHISIQWKTKGVFLNYWKQNQMGESWKKDDSRNTHAFN